jgi:hypothetical protein
MSRLTRWPDQVFQAPDAESVRQALRLTQTHFDEIWPSAEQRHHLDI